VSIPRDIQSEREQISALIGLYQHHLDLFWKWITLYVSIASAISVYIFNKEIETSTRRLFPVLIGVASFGLAFGCLIMWSWLKELEKQVKQLAKEIKTLNYPSFLGIRMTFAAMIASLLFAVFSLAYARFGTFG
jgi:disulfide bond formation protein DsbB